MTSVKPKERDWALALKISQEARHNPSSPYAGKYIGILDGRVVVVAESPEEGIRKLRQIAPDPTEGLLVEASADHEAVEYVWTT